VLVFYLTYLRRELFGRLRLAIVTALGLALGVGLVITVGAASAGVRLAQGDLLRSLYGIGTDVTVTAAPPPQPGPGSGPPPGGGTIITAGPDGGQVCTDGQCSSGPQSIDNLMSVGSGPMPATDVERVAAVPDVDRAAGGLTLVDTQLTFGANGALVGGRPTTFTVNGVDLAHPDLGPLSNATAGTGRLLVPADATTNVAVVDSGYATEHGLAVGGIAGQPRASSPPDVYVPIDRAQALGTGPGDTALTGSVNAIYVAASGSGAIAAVRDRIASTLPDATVTSSADLAGQVSGSLAGTAKLANLLGRWPSVLVLPIDLTIDDGEWLAAQGRTGHGKSTLLHLLAGLDRPTSGTVELDGEPLHSAPERRLTRLRATTIGFVFQRFNLIPTLTAAENVEAALVPLRCRPRERHLRVAAALEAVDLTDRARHRPAELSGGQQQRVAIARALVKEPTVLLADEPTGNLDEDTRDEIVTLLEELWRERRLTLVLVTHDSAIARRAQRVAVMTKGKFSVRRDSRKRTASHLPSKGTDRT
jgi:putative ABC transport system ATP-binding protein